MYCQQNSILYIINQSNIAYVDLYNFNVWDKKLENNCQNLLNESIFSGKYSSS
jgi:hypothetical protein